MERRLDDPARLEDVLEPREVSDLLTTQASLTGCGFRVITASGLEMAQVGPTAGAHASSRPIGLGGVPIGRLEVVADDAAIATRAAAAAAAALEVLIRVGDERRQASAELAAELADAQDEITEKTARLHGAVERLSELDRLKSNFLATISHELRTPLTSVIGYSEMLIEGMAGPISIEQREYLETILAKADSLLQNITGILEVARSEAGGLRVERTPVSILDLIHGVAATLSSEAARRSIALELPAGALPRVLGDSRKLRQVVTHLLSNALKFTPQGGGIAVAAEIGPLGPRTVQGSSRDLGIVVSVRDTGIGIPPGALASIFEPFYQVDSSSTRAYGGTGLGLSLARSYVEAHGGAIWVDSRPGEGSTFTVSLPVLPEDLAAFVASAGQPS